MALAATTLGLCILGIAGAILLVMRQGAPAVGLGLLFVFGALRQALLLYGGDLPAPALDVATFAELSLAGLAVCGLTALRTLHRTTRERDRVEDLHWDSMEAVRLLSELAARPGADLEERLGGVLELGAARFRLDLGVVWLADAEADGEGRVLAVRAPQLEDARRDACLAELRPRLRDASRSARPLLVQGAGTPGTFFGVAVRSAGTCHGSLAFAGTEPSPSRFTATDKDLLGLMAQWLAVELDRHARPAADAADAADAAAAPLQAPLASIGPIARVARDAFRARRGVDLNRGVRRLEPRLRRRVGADATLALDLAPKLPAIARTRLGLPPLLEGLVDAAARLAPTGRIEIATRPPDDTGEEPTLSVSVSGPGVEAAALQRVFEPREDDPTADVAPAAVLPLSGIERLLRADGGDLSVSIEPGRCAQLTAWLPPAMPQAREAADRRPARNEGLQSSR